MARAAPSAEGCVMWLASADMPNADEFRVTCGAACSRSVEWFENQHRRAFTQNHADGGP